MPGLYRANFAFDLHGAYARIADPTALVLEIATPSEDRLIGRQGPAVLLSVIRGPQLETIEEADYHGIALEHRSADVERILRGFLADATP